MKNARFWAVLGIVLVIGSAAAAKLAVADRSFTAEQVAAVTSTCPKCHGSVPAYSHVTVVHSKHASFGCSRCHGAAGSLAATDGLHTGLKWIGIGAVVLVLTGLVANSAVVNKIGKGN